MDTLRKDLGLKRLARYDTDLCILFTCIHANYIFTGGKITLKKGDKLRIVTDYSFKGDNTCIACSYKSLATSVKPGNTILVADGSLSLHVDECDEASGEVVCTIMNDCCIGYV